MTNKEFFMNTWENDSKVTAKAFRSLPDDMQKLHFTHQPKFRSSWQLVNHIGPHGQEIAQAATTGRADLVNEGMFDIHAPHIYKTTEEAALAVENGAAKLSEALTACDDEAWENKNVDVYWGPNKIFSSPLGKFCWTMLFDTIHHRGELASYYRVIGAIQPNLMGPTAEEEEAMMKQASGQQ